MKSSLTATTGAIRAARAFTGRDRVVVCGYHGWQDWYIGSTPRNKGVPDAVSALTHSVPYNDLDALRALFEAHPGEFAAIILEPMGAIWPKDGYLQGLVDLAHEHGALAVFDEVVTGFRLAVGGAQELFGVTPDLVCLGKGLANGYPLAAVAGRADVMKEFEEVFFSFTMGGEAVSLAAAKATLLKIKSGKVIPHMKAQGEKILAGIEVLIEKHDCGSFLSISGYPAWTFLTIADHNGVSLWETKTLYLQKILARGVMALGMQTVSYAHTDEDVAKLLSVYDEVFPILRTAVEDRAVRQYLQCEPLVPLFRVR